MTNPLQAGMMPPEVPDHPNNVQWTAKLPLLVGGVLLAIAGLYLTIYRRSRIVALTGLALIVIGSFFIAYSFTIKEWCKVINPNNAFSSGFSVEFRGCLTAKGWLEL
jgi:disulfide bond formation protein DsbB